MAGIVVSMCLQVDASRNEAFVTQVVEALAADDIQLLSHLRELTEKHIGKMSGVSGGKKVRLLHVVIMGVSTWRCSLARAS